MENWIIKIVFGIFLVITTAIRYPFAKTNKNNSIKRTYKSQIEFFLLLVAWLGMMVIPIVYIILPDYGYGNYKGNRWIQIIGIAIMPFTVWLFYRSHKDLGRNWSSSLEVRDHHSLCDSGVYKYIRHPMYSSIWLWVIIQALLLPNWIAGMSGLIAFGLLYILRIKKEEKMMEEEFGDDYLSYKKRTKRLIPTIL
jgi:protein-S-isoprenylcysteine O-methyltransferase Ste14